MSSENNGVSYKTLNDLPIMEETNDNTYALVADGDSMKRVPGSMLGGGGGIKTAIIKSSDYDNALAGLTPAVGVEEPSITYECVNMTFAQAFETLMRGETLAAVFMRPVGTASILLSEFNELTVLNMSDPTAPAVEFASIGVTWTKDGITIDA